MKKLLTFVAGAVLACGLSACGGASYSKDVLSGEADHISFHAVGGFEGSWSATDADRMTATSVDEVSKLSKAVAKTLAKRSLKYLYSAEIEIKEESAGWEASYWNGTEDVKVDGKFAVKSIRAVFETVDDETVYGSFQWIPNPVSGGAAHVENLSEDTLYMPPWQEAADETGHSWADNPVIKTGQTGKYTLIVAQYNAESTADTAGFGMAVVK